MTKLTITVLVLVIIVGGAAYFKSSLSGGENIWICESGGWTKRGNPPGAMPIGGCGAVQEEKKPEVSTAPFDETGNLAEGDRRWELVYEKPGAPALRVGLQFVPGSSCEYGSDVVSCINNIKYTIGTAGDRVRIVGRLADNVVTVEKMTRISEAAE